ncbi:MAG: N-6 DNA methylase [Anaerolineaceae bacterium]|nr:N-6 DNA methylase [Anaerolineaceae bacterium]
MDDAFLKDIEEWRTLLARNIALRNPQVLDERQLNYAVQMTIDRIIFLRICEDRQIEPENLLLDLTHTPGIYTRLVEVFQRADLKYNSGLFHFIPEKGQTSPVDSFTPGLAIDDKILKEIISSMYYPCPYIFKEIPVEILGQVYEQFLGKVIRLTPSHQAKIEEKPEVRKAGGVYYTPRYIVDYIVQNTVGKLLEGKTPVEAAALKIVDPACGSGSFLLGAYQHLLDWHIDWYIHNDPEKWAKGKDPVIMPASGGGWALTTRKKKDILVNNIHGVDIDAQAVEVTKLSLLLKVLEGESGQLSLGLERALPDLGRNIQCGNSLIGEDYFAGQLVVDEEERRRVNPFEWRHAFPQVFAQGGFNAVIGNPPYRMLQPHNTDIATLNYLRTKYIAAEYKIEFYHMFLQLGVGLLRNEGIQGYIIPSTILSNVYAENLRKWLVGNCKIISISISNDKVFKGADVYTMVLTLQRETSDKRRNDQQILVTTELNDEYEYRTLPFSTVNQIHFSGLPGNVWNILLTETTAPIIIRIMNAFPKLGEVCLLNRGLVTGDRGKYFSIEKKSNDYIPIITGSDVNRYFVKSPSEYVLFKKPKGAGGSWDPEVHLSNHKMVVRQIGTRPIGSLIDSPFAITGNLFSVRANNIEQELFILGLYNSKLIHFFWNILFTDFKNSFPQITLFSLSQVPILIVNESNTNEVAVKNSIIYLVKKMLEMHKRPPATPQEQEQLQRQIAATDRQIDQLVYQLYGLTEDEINIVEGSLK